MIYIYTYNGYEFGYVTYNNDQDWIKRLSQSLRDGRMVYEFFETYPLVMSKMAIEIVDLC